MKTLAIVIILAILFIGCGAAIAKKTKTLDNTSEVSENTIHFVGITIRTDNKSEMDGKGKIPALWQRFFKEQIMQKIKNKTSHSIYGVYYDYQMGANGKYTMLVGCRVKDGTNIPDGMVYKKIPATKYMVFTSKKGPVIKNVITLWEYVWNTWKPTAPTARSFVADFEEYGKESMNMKNGTAKIYIALK